MCVKTKDSVTHNNAEFANIITLARIIGGDGFDDLSSADLDKLLVNRSLSENEIVDFTLEVYHERKHSNNDQEDLPVLNATLIKEGINTASF